MQPQPRSRPFSFEGKWLFFDNLQRKFPYRNIFVSKANQIFDSNGLKELDCTQSLICTGLVCPCVIIIIIFKSLGQRTTTPEGVAGQSLQQAQGRLLAAW